MKKKILLVCSECMQPNYSIKKTNMDERLIVKKFCKQCGKHTIHKENK